MVQDVFSQIRSQMPDFSKGQKRIAAYILDAYDKAAFMTAGELGEITQVSESTVVRFASQLGYKGYPELQKILQELVRSRLTSTQALQAGEAALQTADAASLALQSDMNALLLTNEALDRGVLGEVAEVITKAKHIYIVAVRASYAVAQGLYHRLRIMRPDVILVQSGSASEMLEQLSHADPEDAVLAISLPQYSMRTIKAVQYAKGMGCACMVITDNHQAPLARICHHVLIARQDPEAMLLSMVSAMSVVSSLVISVGRKLGKDFDHSFRELKKNWAKNDIYED